MRTQRQAEAVRDAIHDAVPLRQCSDRLSLRRVVRAACVLAGIDRCGAPCEGQVSPERYSALVDLVASAWAGDVRPLVEPLERKLEALSRDQRYEQAGVVRDRIAAVVRACARMQTVVGAALGGRGGGCARPDGEGGWDLAVIRSGRLVAAGVATRGVAPWPVIEALRATADSVDPTRPPLAEESEIILRWLEQPGTRLADASGPWLMPAFGAGGLRVYLASGGRDAAGPLRRPTPPAGVEPARPYGGVSVRSR